MHTSPPLLAGCEYQPILTMTTNLRECQVRDPYTSAIVPAHGLRFGPDFHQWQAHKRMVLPLDTVEMEHPIEIQVGHAVF